MRLAQSQAPARGPIAPSRERLRESPAHASRSHRDRYCRGRLWEHAARGAFRRRDAAPRADAAAARRRHVVVPERARLGARDRRLGVVVQAVRQGLPGARGARETARREGDRDLDRRGPGRDAGIPRGVPALRPRRPRRRSRADGRPAPGREPARRPGRRRRRHRAPPLREAARVRLRRGPTTCRAARPGASTRVYLASVAAGCTGGDHSASRSSSIASNGGTRTGPDVCIRTSSQRGSSA